MTASDLPPFAPLHATVVSTLEHGLERTAAEAFRRAHRDRQTERGDRLWRLTMSGLGACPREQAYKLAGTPPTDPQLAVDAESRQAILGTWIHDDYLPHFADALAGSTEEMPVELTVHHDGDLPPLVVTGTTDIYTTSMGGGIVDLKTLGAFLLGNVSRYGVRESHRHQVRGYAAAARQWGYPVAWIAWLYMDRADGRVLVHVEPYGEDAEAEVLDRIEWLLSLAATPDAAPRTEYGPGLSPACNGCAWLKQCWGPAARPRDSRSLRVHSDPEIALAAEKYKELGDQIRPLKKEQAMWGAMVDRPTPGAYGAIRVTYQRDREELDEEAAFELLRAHGIEPPTKPRQGNRILTWLPRPEGKE